MPGQIRPSLLDRLVDEPGPPGCNLEEYTRSVVRDLNDLVNTPRTDLNEIPEHFKEVRTSVLSYGLPRPGLLGKSTQDRERVRADLKESILRFEPRLSSVNITETRGGQEAAEEASVQPYAFKIMAMLRSDPLPSELIVLGATLSRYPEAIQVLPGPPAELVARKDDDER